MMRPSANINGINVGNNRGFSLVELMVVLAIVGILATGVVFMFADPTAKVKAAAFEMRGDFNLARAEAVRRNTDILVDFIFTAEAECSTASTADFAKCFSGTGAIRGYVVCFDEDGNNECQNDGTTVADLREKIIKAVLFRDSVKYYKFAGAPPASGPATAPDGDSLAANNGITFTNDYVSMNPDGTCSDTGSLIIYLSAEGSDQTIRGNPYAVVVDSTSTGKVRLERWRPDPGAWSRK